jgi:hypothetical protein
LSPFGHLVGYGHGAGQTRAVQEDCSARACGFAKERPAANLHLGDKETGHGRRKDEDIQVAEVVGHNQSMIRRSPVDAIVNSHPCQYPASSLLGPQRATLQRNWTAQPKQPIADNAEGQSQYQRHSAPDRAKAHVVRGVRKRLRAEGESNFRSSSVRKSMVPNSLSQAGGQQTRAPIAR